MNQIRFKLLLCLFLAISASGNFNTGNRFTGHQAGMVRGGSGSFGIVPGANSFGHFGEQSRARMANFDGMNVLPAANNWGLFGSQLTAAPTPSVRMTDQSGFSQQPSDITMNRKPAMTEDASSLVSNVQVPSNGNSYSGSSLNGLSLGNGNNYGKSYTEPTGPPFGIRSTGHNISYLPEKLDLSRCGPPPTANPCTPFGPQYYPLPGYPHCYIQCAFGRLLVKPCPTNLVWNERIDVCDWPTVASPVTHNYYDKTLYGNMRNFDDSSSYQAANKNYRSTSMSSFGRKKRSIIERKKRGYEGYYPSTMMQSNQSPFARYFGGPLAFPPRPLAVPLTPVKLPGPVSFSGNFGLPNIPSSSGLPQATTQASAPPSYPMTVPAAAAMTPNSPTAPPAASLQTILARSTVPYNTLYGGSYGPPSGAASSYGNLYGNLYGASGSAFPASAATAQAMNNVFSSMGTTAPVAPGMTARAFSSPMLSQPNVPPSFSPVSLTAMLVPGPLYPYGPPNGEPFGGRLSPPFSPFGGKTVPPFVAYGGQSPPMSRSILSPPAQPFAFFGSHPAQMFRSVGGQPIQSFGGFGGQFGQPFGFAGTQPGLCFRSVGGQPPQAFRSYMNPYSNALRKINEATDSPLGFDFDLHIHPFDDDSDSSNYAKVSLENTDKYIRENADKNDEKTSGNDFLTKSYAFDVNDYYYPKTSDDNRNGNFRSYETKSNYNKYDTDDNSELHYRKKRQYDSFISTKTEHMPIVSTTGQKQLLPAEARLKSHEFMTQTSFRRLPCIGKPPSTNIAHPIDPRKYIACLNEIHYQIMECPNGLIYNPVVDQCQKKKNTETICERNRPCMNNGQCYQTSPSTYKCTCLGSWTGERCETPLSSCVNNPCGQGNECHTLKTNDYGQDYVCVCNEYQSYGLNCGRNTMPNPCLAASTEQEQYYPFAFSAQAFVQCNGDIFHVQPCGSDLYWNQEAKVCDRVATIPSLTGQDKSQLHQTVHGNEQQMAYIRPTSNSIDSTSSLYRPLENKVFSSQKQPNFNSFQMLSRLQQQPSVPITNGDSA